MPDILQDLPIRALRARVFTTISTPAGLDVWWTKRARGEPRLGAEYELWFGPQYDWRAEVTLVRPDTAFELRMTKADDDWLGTRVAFQLDGGDAPGAVTLVRFAHTGWPKANEHFRTSKHCWALYLRLLRRHLVHGETVPYERRLDA